MIQKQLYITPEIDRALQILARREGKPVAEVHREILERELVTKSKPRSGAEVLLRLTGVAGKGPKDLSTNLFDYLYGDKSPDYGRRKKAIHRR